MKFTELKNYLSGCGGGAFLLAGDDAYFLSRAEEMIKKAFLSLPELNFAAFDGENLKGENISRLTDALSAYPFMAEKRVVRVSDFYPSESEFERYLRPLLADFPDTAVLIVVNSRSKKGAADLKRKRGLTYVDCGKADEEEVTRWIYLTLKRAGIAAEAEACINMARYCLCDMSRVAIETEKIVEYKDGRGTLSAAEVDELVYKDTDYRVYEMTGAVAAKNYSRFYEIAEELTERGMDGIAVMNSLLSYLKNLVTVAKSHRSDAELSSLLGMKEYGVKRTREQAKRLGTERAERLCSLVYGAISGVKRGELTPDSAYKLVCSQIFFGAD